MLPEDYTDFISDLTSLVKKKIVPMSRIDDAVKRILRVKFVMGLFENPMADLSFADQLGKKVSLSLSLSLTCTLMLSGLCVIKKDLLWMQKKCSSKALVYFTGTQGIGERSCKKITCATEKWKIF